MLSAVLSYWMMTLGKNFQLHAFSITSWRLLCIANTKTACVQNAAFHLLWMTFPSQCNILKFLILILHLLFAKTRALHSYYNAQNDIRWLYFSASNLFSSMGYYSWNIQSWCASKPLHILHWSSSMCNYINHFILFYFFCPGYYLVSLV